MLSLLALSYCILLAAALTIRHEPRSNLQSRDDTISTQTTYIDFTGCTAAQKESIVQSNKDALLIAKAALTYKHDELFVNTDGRKSYIDFETQAAYDYFSDSTTNAPYQQQIYNTFLRATLAYRGLGWSDWWNDRYVTISCNDLKNNCKGATGAYTYKGANDKYPTIVYCSPFFSLKTLAEQVKAVKADSTGSKKHNTKNLFSQGMIVNTQLQCRSMSLADSRRHGLAPRVASSVWNKC